jgi:hypothetical protein
MRTARHRPGPPAGLGRRAAAPTGQGRPPRRHRHRPDRRPAGQPRVGRHRISRGRQLARAGFTEDLGDRLPGDLQPGQRLPARASRSLNRAISLRSSSASRRAAVSHGRHLPVVDTWAGKTQPGEANPAWIPLVPSGRPAF